MDSITGLNTIIRVNIMIRFGLDGDMTDVRPVPRANLIQPDQRTVELDPLIDHGSFRGRWQLEAEPLATVVQRYSFCVGCPARQEERHGRPIVEPTPLPFFSELGGDIYLVSKRRGVEGVKVVVNLIPDFFCIE